MARRVRPASHGDRTVRRGTAGPTDICSPAEHHPSRQRRWLEAKIKSSMEMAVLMTGSCRHDRPEITKEAGER
jgi:hypothetical protein